MAFATSGAASHNISQVFENCLLTTVISIYLWGSYCVLAILKTACLAFWKEDLHVSWILLTSNKGTVCIFTDTNKPVPGIQSRVVTELCESSPPSYTSPSKSSGGKNKIHKLCISAFLTFQRPSAGLLASFSSEPQNLKNKHTVLF